MNIKGRAGSFVLAALLTVGLSACAAENSLPPQTVPTGIPIPTLTTVPFEKEEPNLPVTGPSQAQLNEASQIRLTDVRSGWKRAFETTDGAFFVATSVQMLMDGLSQRGIDPAKLDLSGYDDSFFTTNRLVIIPRTSNSGSVRYSARMTKTDDGVKVSLVGKMPEIGTADMADWLVLVPLELQVYPGKVIVEGVRTIPGDAKRYAIHRF